MWGCVTREVQVGSNLPDGVERRPESDELGPYAEFVLDQENLPLLRRFSSEGIIHWLSNKKEHTTGNIGGIFQSHLLNKLYYSKRKNVEERGWYEWPVDNIRLFMGTIFLTMLYILWLKEFPGYPTIPILISSVMATALLHAIAVDGWNNGVECRTDVYTNIPEAIVVWSVGAGGVVALTGIIDWYAGTEIGAVIGFWEGLLGTWATVSTAYVIRAKTKFNDKEPFLKWTKEENGNIIARSLKAHDDEGTKDAWRKGFSNLAHNTLIVENPDLRFPDGDKSEHPTISRKERYHLALLRKNGLWDDSSKTASYAKWLGWSEEDIAANNDEDIWNALARYIENRTEADLRNSLGRVMGEEQILQYLPGLVGNPEFWLKREVTVKTNESDSGEKESFLQWVDRVICSSGVHYLVSEAAKGKSTTLNLLTLHHVNSESGIWPLRVKLRELYLRTSEQPLIQRVREFYKINADKRFNYVEERFDAVMDGDATPPLLILDGLDELPPRNQIELLDELKNESWPIPILVVTRPDKRILGRGHAVLGKMTGQQRVEVLRNLDLDPEVLRQMENLPEALIDRPFALLIAAEKIRVEQTSSLEAGDINLSLSEISKMYEENYFEREAEKKSWLEKLGDNLSYVEPIKDALNHLAIHHIRHHAPPQRNDPAVVERKEFLDVAVKLKIIDSDLNMIDGWLTGFYAARSPDFRLEAWNAVLEDVYQNPDRSELIIRYLVASASAEQTQNWDMLGLDAPVVMDIASQEWLAMDRSSRKSMMRRFGIPHDDEGRLDFPPEHDFMECELPELLALLHFHCSIADTEGWHSPEENTDTQWEVLFTALTMRYYEEFKDEIYRLEKEVNPPPGRHNKGPIKEEWDKSRTSYYGRRFALGNVLSCFPDQMESFLQELFGEGYARGVNRVRKLVPYNHHRDARRDILDHDVMYFGDAAPSPLLRVIEERLDRGDEELQSLIFAVGMIEIHAERRLFKLSRAVLDESVPSAYEIKGEPRIKALIMLHRIIGYRLRMNNKLIYEFTEMQLPESDFGIPLEIIWDGSESKGYSPYARRFLSDEEFCPLEQTYGHRGNQHGAGRSRQEIPSHFVNDKLRVKHWRGWYRRRTDSGVGVKITEKFLSTLIIPDRDLNEKDRLLSMKDLSQYLPSRENRTPIVTMYPYITIDQTLEQGSYSRAAFDSWKKTEAKEYYASLPSENSRLRRIIRAPVENFITSRLKLQWKDPEPYHPYLVCFRGEGYAVDTEPVANAVSLIFNKDLLSWIIGTRISRRSRKRTSHVYRQPNTDLAEVYRNLMRIDNRRFQPSTMFEDIEKKLAGLRKTGKVAVYLKRGEKQIGGKTHRVLLVPETDWKDRDFTDLTYELGHTGIEEAFSSIYLAVPGAPEDAHLNRWYAVDFVLGSDDRGGRYIFPDHETIEPLCQLCAAETIEIKGDPNQIFICGGCSEWWFRRPENEEE
jgi:hypothetical protein